MPRHAGPAARQRSSTQTKKEKEKAKSAQETRILDEQEQEAEIKHLRRQNRRDNEQNHYTLDAGVSVVLLLSFIHFLRQIDDGSLPLIILCLLQTLLLPLSLTPSRIPPLSALTTRYHQLIVLTQLVIFVLAYIAIGQDKSFVRVARWALPELVTGAVEIARRGERGMEKRLKELEALRYNAKGP
ncbi:hypothetical protein BCR39DRAFT_552473 [Naematelia encephala]|uniref:Uncharacterized protein n=1 Tax=Naematelia encephala TaxID=71784 RepID=A0A1Y2AHE7_9TREE|nr:hypothetical protein BCR39DRAFT_552473 [Naematelia encephala]